MKEKYGKFVDLIKTVNINVPLVELLAGVPNYAKFIKELVTDKEKLKEAQATVLNAECSSIVQNGRIPPKLNDPGSFLISCNFNNSFTCEALADLGASINLMPKSLSDKLALGPLKPTQMSIRLADRSCQYPLGIAENVLVQVGKFIFPVDFVILEMEEDSKVPLILGRPFLNTADAIIRVKNKEISLGFGDDRVVFNIEKAMRHSYSNEKECFSIEVVDNDFDTDSNVGFESNADFDIACESEDDLFDELDDLIMKVDLEEIVDEKEEKLEDVDVLTVEEFGRWLDDELDGLETISPIKVNMDFDFKEDMKFFEGLEEDKGVNCLEAVSPNKLDEKVIEKEGIVKEKPPELFEIQLQGMVEFVDKLIPYLLNRRDESFGKVGVLTFYKKECKARMERDLFLMVLVILAFTRKWLDAKVQKFKELFVVNEFCDLFVCYLDNCYYGLT